MTNKKNGFLTFCFSLLPGAGEMYMGFMKQGLSLMTLFFLTIAVGAWLELGPGVDSPAYYLVLQLFHVHNLRALPEEEFYEVQDDYLLFTDADKIKDLVVRFRTVAAILLILLGVDIIWNNMSHYIVEILPEYWSERWWMISGAISRTIPQLIVAGLIIYAGVCLIRGKKKELNSEQEYGGEE